MKASLADHVKNALKHSHAEGAGDMAGTMETLEADPVYDLYPIARRLKGYDGARRYYEHFFKEVLPRIAGFEMVSEWVGDAGINQEYDVRYRYDDGRTRTFRILGILTFGETKMSGERLYAEEELLRIMFAPVWGELQPI